MADGFVHVNAPSVLAYGRDAQDIFGRIRTSLEELVSDVVAVSYYGPNATEFKTKCGQIAADFAAALTSDMRAIAGAVSASTSNISDALGGRRITIEFDGAAITPPAVPQGDSDTVGADLGALESLKGAVRSKFAAISEHFVGHLGKLSATDWRGNAKENAVQAVTTFTNSAKSKVDDANSELTNFIDRQVEALRRGDQ